MNLIQRVQRNHQCIRVFWIPLEIRNDRRIRLLVKSEMRLRDGQVPPDVVILRLALQREPQRLEGVGGLPEPKPRVGDDKLQHGQVQLRRAGALP